MPQTTIGVISDTHGLLRPQAIEALAGSSLILHAGDVGKPEVLEKLATIAPVKAVLGNVDSGPWTAALPERLRMEIEGVRILMLHIFVGLPLDPASEGIDVIISGHSHKPSLEERNGVLYLNPGSAGPRRFRLPVSVARLYLGAGKALAEIVNLDV